MSPRSSNNHDHALVMGFEDEISVQPEHFEDKTNDQTESPNDESDYQSEHAQGPTFWQVITTKVKDYGLVLAVGIAAILVARFAKSARSGNLTGAMSGAMSGLGMIGTKST